jgi:hypothetical protein
VRTGRTDYIARSRRTRQASPRHSRSCRTAAAPIWFCEPEGNVRKVNARPPPRTGHYPADRETCDVFRRGNGSDVVRAYAERQAHGLQDLLWALGTLGEDGPGTVAARHPRRDEVRSVQAQARMQFQRYRLLLSQPNMLRPARRPLCHTLARRKVSMSFADPQCYPFCGSSDGSAQRVAAMRQDVVSQSDRTIHRARPESGPRHSGVAT